MCFRLGDLCFSKIVYRRSYLGWSRLQKQTPVYSFTPLSICFFAALDVEGWGGAAYGKEYRIRPSIATTTTTVFPCANESERATAPNVHTALAVVFRYTARTFCFQHNNSTLFNLSNILLKHFKVRLKNSMKNSFVQVFEKQTSVSFEFENFWKITKRC